MKPQTAAFKIEKKPTNLRSNFCIKIYSILYIKRGYIQKTREIRNIKREKKQKLEKYGMYNEEKKKKKWNCIVTKKKL